MNIGEKIRSKRREREYTLKELGDKVNLKKSTIHRYESNLINIPSDNLKKLAIALDTTPEYLMGWSEDISNEEKYIDTSFLTDAQKAELETLISINQGMFIKDGYKVPDEDLEKLRMILTKIYIQSIKEKNTDYS